MERVIICGTIDAKIEPLIKKKKVPSQKSYFFLSLKNILII